MIKKLRFLALGVLVSSAFFAGPVLAEDVEIDEGGFACTSGMWIQYGSDVTQGAAQAYCETLACKDVCTSIGCSGGGNSSASQCSTCGHSSSWTYAAHGTCNCTPGGS